MVVSSKITRACGVLAAVHLAGLWCSPISAQLPISQMRAIFPPAAQVGTTANVEVLGSGPLDDINRLIFSQEKISANVLPGESNPITNTTQTQFGKFTISSPGDTPVGFYEVWAAGRNGVSIPRVFWIAPRPIVASPKPVGEGYVPLNFENIVVDRYIANKSQLFEVALSKGQRVRISVLDAKLDSRALTKLRVLDPNARPVQEARSTGEDGAIVAFTAQVAGNFRVQVNDAIYRGGDDFYFALFVENQESSPINPGEYPWNSREQMAQALSPGSGQVSVARRTASFDLKRWLSASHPLIVLDPAATEPLKVALPVTITGRFKTSSSLQAFEFTAKKGEAYWLDLASHQLGQRTDPYMAIYKVTKNAEGIEKLDRVVEQDDPAAIGAAPYRVVRSDPSIKLDVPADATYRVVVRDQLATNDSRSGGKFALDIRKPQPSLSVLVAWAPPTNVPAQIRPTGNNILAGSAAALRVIVMRNDGLSGPVEISCEGLPPGASCPSIVLPADRDEGVMIIGCDEKAPPFTGKIKFIACSQSDKGISAEAIGTTLTWEPIPTWNALTGRLSQQLMVNCNAQDLAPISFIVGGTEPLQMARGGKLPLPIKLTRRTGGADKVVMRPQNLPAKTTLGEVAIEGKDSEAKPEMAIAADAPVGEATFWFQVESKVKFRTNPQAFERAEAERAQLEKMQADKSIDENKKKEIDAALKAATEKANKLKELTAEKEQQVFIPSSAVRIKILEGPIDAAGTWNIVATRGTESDHELSIKRTCGFEGPVDLKLVADPKSQGLELAAPVIAADAQKTVCHIKIAKDSPLGERTVNVKLSYKFNNQDLSMQLPLTIVVRE